MTLSMLSSNIQTSKTIQIFILTCSYEIVCRQHQIEQNLEHSAFPIMSENRACEVSVFITVTCVCLAQNIQNLQGSKVHTLKLPFQTSGILPS